MPQFGLAGWLIVLLLIWPTAGAAQATDPAAQIEPSNQSVTARPLTDSTSQDAETGQTSTSEKKSRFATIGYLWVASAHGETDVIGPAEPVGLDLSFRDALDAFKFAFMGAAELRYDRFVLLADLTFIHLEAKKGVDIREQDFLDAELDSRTSEITLVGGYRVVDKGPVMVDLFAGARLNWFKTTLQLEGPNRSAEGVAKETWLDPLVATRVVAPLGGKWSSAIYGDIGGIIAGSDITWQLFGTVNYQIKPKMQIGAGWRVFKIHFDEGVFLYDVAQNGPIITFRTDF